MCPEPLAPSPCNPDAGIVPKAVRRLWLVLLFTVLAATVVVLYHPALDLELTGDDYQWVQLAHRAEHHPGLMLSALGTIYRPALTWSLMVERQLWPWNPAGYHLGNLVLHLCAALLLAVAARRLGQSRTFSSGVAIVWALSPFATEPAIWISARSQHLLLIAWMALIATWPKAEEKWSAWRCCAAGCALILAMFSKETWVATWMIVAAVDRMQRGPGWRRVMAHAVPVLGLGIIFTLLHFWRFGQGSDYFNLSTAMLFKVPHMFAAFFYFEVLQPMLFSFSWTATLALLAVIAGFCLCLRSGRSDGVVGGVLAVSATLPALLVPFLPIRFTTIPYAGFLLLAAACAAVGVTALQGAARAAARAAVGALAALLTCAGCFMIRAELADWSRCSALHSRLLHEAREIAGQLPQNTPLLIVRGDRAEPLADLARDPRGLPKMWFARHAEPYGLADIAAIFEWVLQEEDLVVLQIDAPHGPGRVLVHSDGGFSWQGAVPDTAEAAAQWSTKGFRLRVIQASTENP